MNPTPRRSCTVQVVGLMGTEPLRTNGLPFISHSSLCHHFRREKNTEETKPETLENEFDEEHLFSPQRCAEITELRASTMAGDQGEGSVRKPRTGVGVPAEEDAVERDRTDDKARADSPHQEFGEARLGP